MISVPVHLLIESLEHVVTVELCTGESYRGKLVKAEDNMNLQLSDVVATAKDGEKSHMNSAFVRGSHVQMVVLPELLKLAPILRPDLTSRATSEAKARKQKTRAKKPPRKLQKIA